MQWLFCNTCKTCFVFISFGNMKKTLIFLYDNFRPLCIWPKHLNVLKIFYRFLFFNFMTLLLFILHCFVFIPRCMSFFWSFNCLYFCNKLYQCSYQILLLFGINYIIWLQDMFMWRDILLVLIYFVMFAADGHHC